MALWAPWLYGPHGPMGSMALLAPWPYGPCAILALYLTAAIRYNSFNGRNQHTAFLWSGGPLIQRGQHHRVTYMCAQRMVKRDMIYHSPVIQCMSK